jgi:hypothetical protein
MKTLLGFLVLLLSFAIVYFTGRLLNWMFENNEYDPQDYGYHLFWGSSLWFAVFVILLISYGLGTLI